MPDKTPPPLENVTTTSIFKNQKKTIIIASIIVVVLLLGVLALVLLNSNAAKQNTGGFAYLPEGTCPDNIFQENGLIRADYQGKPYVLSTQQETNIKNTCPKYGKVPEVDIDANKQMSPTPTVVQETEPPLLLKSVGFNLGEFDAATNTAGDIKFTKTPLPFDQIFSPFGQQDPRTPDPTKTNPQPTVILPLGTKVHALVDGIVVEKKELYSGDWTVWVAKDSKSTYFYETEHINNPTVNKGDKVTAGQIIGEVSDYDSHNNPGFGLVEIGILHALGTGEPEHVCPYKYLDPSIKDDINSKLMSLYAAWEAYLGKDIYKQETFVSAGCVVETPAKG